jgi:hypothetical protein
MRWTGPSTDREHHRGRVPCARERLGDSLNDTTACRIVCIGEQDPEAVDGELTEYIRLSEHRRHGRRDLDALVSAVPAHDDVPSKALTAHSNAYERGIFAPSERTAQRNACRE